MSESRLLFSGVNETRKPEPGTRKLLRPEDFPMAENRPCHTVVAIETVYLYEMCILCVRILPRPLRDLAPVLRTFITAVLLLF